MPCTARPPCRLESVPLDAIRVEWGGQAVGRKALAFPGRRLIQLDPVFWRSIRTVDGRAAILAHERAHIEGARCESCADRRAGEILRAEGHPTPRDAARVMAGRLENRDADAAARDLLDGFGLDEVPLPSGKGWLHNVDRAQGLRSKRLVSFLSQLHAEGLSHRGQRYAVTVGVDGGVRTDARQLALYAKGRELRPDGWHVVDASQVVTNARTASQSKHGRGLAVDLWPVLPSGAPLLRPEQSPDFAALYDALGVQGERHGLTWGGRWSSLVDRPHFEDDGASPLTMGAAALALVLLVAATVILSP